MNFDELIMQAAREFGIQQYVSVSPYRDTNPVAIVKYEGKTVNREIPLDIREVMVCGHAR